MKNKKYFLIIVSGLFSSIILNGCGVWHDFTTYFNLYYNTSDVYNQAEELIIVERNKDLFAITEPNLPGSTPQQLQKVIEKSSKILQFNSESSFVDDALFMLGKSFYFLKNYPKAIRKFRELIVQFPESNLVPETEVWIVRCHLQMKEYSQALTLINEIKTKAKENDDDEILVFAYIEQIKYFIILNRFTEAITYCKELLEISKDGFINAQTAYQIGELNYYKLERYEEAANAYKSVLNYSPSFDMELSAQVKYGKVMRSIEKYDEALTVFEKLRKEDKNSTSYDMIDLEIGITFARMEKYDEAYIKLKNVDTAYSNSVYSGPARFELAEMFELHLHNYDSANYYYQKALSSSSTPEYIPWIKNKAAQFSKYSSLTSQIKDYSQQLYYVNNPEEYTKDSLAFFSDTLQQKTNDDVRTGTLPPRTGRERNFEGIQNPPPNVNQTTALNQSNKKMPIKPNLSADSLKKLLARSEYELGNLFFTELDVPDSAFYYYKNVVEGYDSLSFEPQLLFAIGSYYLTINDTTRADSIFSYIYDHYKSERIVNAAADKIGKPKIDFDYDPAKDVFIVAESFLQKNDYKTSVEKYYSIYNNFPGSKYAPKSLMAAGWILENKLKMLDSAASVYDTLVTKYPRTEYASAINPKISFYKEEKARIKKAIEDSLKAIQDSINRVKEQIRLKREADSLEVVRKQDSIRTAKMNDSLKLHQINEPKIDQPEEKEKPEEEQKKSDIEEEKKFDQQIEPTQEEKPPGFSFLEMRNNFYYFKKNDLCINRHNMRMSLA